MCLQSYIFNKLKITLLCGVFLTTVERSPAPGGAWDQAINDLKDTNHPSLTKLKILCQTKMKETANTPKFKKWDQRMTKIQHVSRVGQSLEEAKKTLSDKRTNAPNSLSQNAAEAEEEETQDNDVTSKILIPLEPLEFKSMSNHHDFTGADEGLFKLLPLEVNHHIFTFLDSEGAWMAANTCMQWRRIILVHGRKFDFFIPHLVNFFHAFDDVASQFSYRPIYLKNEILKIGGPSRATWFFTPGEKTYWADFLQQTEANIKEKLESDIKIPNRVHQFTAHLRKASPHTYFFLCRKFIHLDPCDNYRGVWLASYITREIPAFGKLVKKVMKKTSGPVDIVQGHMQNRQNFLAAKILCANYDPEANAILEELRKKVSSEKLKRTEGHTEVKNNIIQVIKQKSEKMKLGRILEDLRWKTYFDDVPIGVSGLNPMLPLAFATANLTEKQFFTKEIEKLGSYYLNALRSKLTQEQKEDIQKFLVEARRLNESN